MPTGQGQPQAKPHWGGCFLPAAGGQQPGWRSGGSESSWLLCSFGSRTSKEGRCFHHPGHCCCRGSEVRFFTKSPTEGEEQAPAICPETWASSRSSSMGAAALLQQSHPVHALGCGNCWCQQSPGEKTETETWAWAGALLTLGHVGISMNAQHNSPFPQPRMSTPWQHLGCPGQVSLLLVIQKANCPRTSRVSSPFSSPSWSLKASSHSAWLPPTTHPNSLPATSPDPRWCCHSFPLPCNVNAPRSTQAGPPGQLHCKSS